MRILIGVDAGASHSTAAVANEHGTVLVRSDGGPGAMRPGAAAAVAARILDTCREALHKAEREVRGDVLVVGAAGVGREEERLALQAALEDAGLAPRVAVTVDGAIALQSAFGDAAGIVLLAGTGSVAWARLPGGDTARVGGLGAVVGDQGSGYELARQALRAVGLSIEGRGRRTTLSARLLARLRLTGLGELVRWATVADIPMVATLAPDVLAAAEEGDAVAGALVDAGADDLATHVRALAERYPRGAEVGVALGGSLLARNDDYRKRVVARIVADVPSATIRPEPVDPVLGAVQLARAL
ncbi:MAG TPA: BadF/BadG/BcrA/BcrD ATPase family protein [Gemmatimonadales bacterium]|nr:BadF/BadG/BcrA/BcrD ATPase family protein [Gemmatimonadales bacterium]